MKKFGILAALLVLMVSCSDDTPDTSWKVITVRVLSSDWVASVDNNGQNLYYSCSVNLPELSAFIYQNGIVQTSYVKDGVQLPLPYVRHHENTDGNLWTTTVDNEYEVGRMYLYVTNSDFFNERPETMNFRIVLLW